jgi:hypothetical protein
MMERIYFLIAEVKVRQAERLQVAEVYRRVKELKRDDGGPSVNIQSRLGAALFALGTKVKRKKRTQASVLKEEGVGSEANLCC